MNDEQKALLLVGALLFSTGGAGGFAGGRVTAPVPPAEVRIVHVQAPAVVAATAEAEPSQPAVIKAPAPARQLDPPPLVDVKAQPAPLPTPRPKIVETKPKERAAVKPRPAVRPVRKPSAGECAQLKLGMLTIGRDAVNVKAKARGYSSAQVAWALTACGL